MTDDFLKVVELEDRAYNSILESVNYKVVNTQKGIEDAIADLWDKKIVGVDTENTGLDPHKDKPLLLQIGTDDLGYVFDGFRAELDFTPVKEYLEREDVLKLLFNAKYDCKFLYHHYGIFLKNIYDIQIAERLLTVGKLGSSVYPALPESVRKYLGLEMNKSIRNAFIDRDPFAYPITDTEYRYSAADTTLLPSIYYLQKAEVESEGFVNVGLLEFELAPVLADMELSGILINREKWLENVKLAQKKQNDVAQKLYPHFAKVAVQKNLFGLPTINLESNPQLLSALKSMGIKDIEDTQEGTLEALTYKLTGPKDKGKKEVLQLLIEYRGWSKVINTYGEKFISHISDITGRLHAECNQMRADTGRTSYKSPNMQNIPAFDPEDPESLDFRSCIIARPGYKLITADYAQQELRILGEYSLEPNFIKAYTEKDVNGNELDIHTYTASVVFNVPYEEVTPAQRKAAKTINFGLIYGQSAPALAEALGIHKNEAKRLIDDYFARYTKIKGCLNEMAKSAVNYLYSTTVSGRKRFYYPLPPQDDPDFDKRRAALEREGKNSPIQGAGADVTKKALILIHNKIKEKGYDARILMQVHDEIVVEVREDQAEEVAKEVVEREMIAAWDFFFKIIPMRVDAHVSDTWEK